MNLFLPKNITEVGTWGMFLRKFPKNFSNMSYMEILNLIDGNLIWV